MAPIKPVTLFMAEASYVTALIQQYLTFSEILQAK